MSGTEVRGWYWLKDELVAFARVLGVQTSGGKQVLTARITATLDGVDFAEPVPTSRPGRQLTAPLDVSTRVPAGQRCSQLIRAWFSHELQCGFRFDARMRDWFAAADGTQTLGDTLAHHLNRDAGREPSAEAPEIGVQFEYNRFARDWYAQNPGGTPIEMRAAWQTHRSLPRGPARGEP